MQAIRERAQEKTGALALRPEKQSVPVEYAVAADIEDYAAAKSGTPGYRRSRDAGQSL